MMNLSDSAASETMTAADTATLETADLPAADPRRLLTHSRMACAKTCLRKHYLRYELGIRPDRSSAPLRLGSAVHKALEQYDTLADQIPNASERRDLIEGMIRQTYSEPPDWVISAEDYHAWNTEKETAVWLFRGHIWRWHNEQYEVVATEQAFNLPLRNPATGAESRVWRLAGKIDRIVRLPDGRLAVQEYKTTSDDLSPASDYWKRLRIDSQISIYMLAARELGYDVQTVLYDVIRKPSISPRQIPLVDDDGKKIVLDADGQRVYNKAKKDGTADPRQTGDTALGYVLQTRSETPEEFGLRLRADIFERPDYYYARQEIARTEADLEEAAEEIWQQQQLLRDCQRTGRWFRNTGSCHGFGRCEYFDICTQGLDVTSYVPPGFVHVVDLHPELTS